jgi:hypothetical protein
MSSKKSKNNRRIDAFNAQAFLDTAGVARKVSEYRQNESIYSEGHTAETVTLPARGANMRSLPQLPHPVLPQI